MPSQHQIETAAGINEVVAKHMMAENTPAARNAMRCLKLCVDSFEQGAFTLLKAAVADCRLELKD